MTCEEISFIDSPRTWYRVIRPLDGGPYARVVVERNGSVTVRRAMPSDVAATRSGVAGSVTVQP